MIIWIFNTPDIENEAVYIQFTEKKMSAQLPDALNIPDIFEIVKNYQKIKNIHQTIDLIDLID